MYDLEPLPPRGCAVESCPNQEFEGHMLVVDLLDSLGRRIILCYPCASLLRRALVDSGVR